MNELFYFAFAELMVRIEYDQEANALRYASHRKIAAGERIIVEQYILASFATKTDYFKRPPSRFIYLGLEALLVKYLDRFHRQTSLEKEKDIEASVAGLINQSLQHFYFEQIGDAILAMRQELSRGGVEAGIVPLRRKMGELVKAYNHYAAQRINITEVIPAELQPHFGLSVSPRTGGRSFAAEVSD